jgi:riboflavin synthase
MFTGIITNKGKIIKVSDRQLSIESDLARKLNVGDSISINGICLTVIEVSNHNFSIDFISETDEKTSISKLRPNDTVNLELPATPASLLSGHIVQGHVDTTATLKEIIQEKNQKTLLFELSKDLSKYMVNKGSVSINGVSLTVIEVSKKEFSVGIIPHTYKATTFSQLNVGGVVNIEVDVLAKYIEKLIKGNNE